MSKLNPKAVPFVPAVPPAGTKEKEKEKKRRKGPNNKGAQQQQENVKTDLFVPQQGFVPNFMQPNLPMQLQTQNTNASPVSQETLQQLAAQQQLHQSLQQFIQQRIQHQDQLQLQQQLLQQHHQLQLQQQQHQMQLEIQRTLQKAAAVDNTPPRKTSQSTTLSPTLQPGTLNPQQLAGLLGNLLPPAVASPNLLPMAPSPALLSQLGLGQQPPSPMVLPQQPSGAPRPLTSPPNQSPAQSPALGPQPHPYPPIMVGPPLPKQISGPSGIPSQWNLGGVPTSRTETQTTSAQPKQPKKKKERAKKKDKTQQSKQSEQLRDNSNESLEHHGDNDAFVVVFIGPPGVGKTTQARLICEHFQFTHFALGDKLREMHKNGEARARHWSMGNLSALANELLDQCLCKASDDLGVVLEYVKTAKGGEIVEQLCAKYGLKVGCVIMLSQDDIWQLVTRMHNREDEREDDKHVTNILDRVWKSMQWEAELEEFYKDNHVPFLKLDTSGSVEDVAQILFEFIYSVRDGTEMPEIPEPMPIQYDEIESSLFRTLKPATEQIRFLRSKTQVKMVLSKLRAHGAIPQDLYQKGQQPYVQQQPVAEKDIKTMCFSSEHYVVSKKVEGMPFMLYYSSAEGYSYLINMTYKVFSANVASLIGCPSMILEGEMVVLNKNPAFIVHGVLFLEGKDLQELDVRARMALVPNVPFSTEEKRIQVIPRLCHSMKELAALLRNEIDSGIPQGCPLQGLIFTPLHKPNLGHLVWKSISSFVFRIKFNSETKQGTMWIRSGQQETLYRAGQIQVADQQPRFRDIQSFDGSLVTCTRIGNTNRWQIVDDNPNDIKPCTIHNIQDASDILSSGDIISIHRSWLQENDPSKVVSRKS